MVKYEPDCTYQNTTFQRKLVFCNQMAQKLFHMMNVLIHDHLVTHRKKLPNNFGLDGCGAGLSGTLHDIKLNAQALFEEGGESIK